MSSDLRERARVLAGDVQSYTKELDKVRKALEALAQEPTWNDRALRTRSLKALSGLRDRSLPDVETARAELEKAVQEHQRSVRQGFLEQLIPAIEAEKITWRELGQQPPVLDIGGIQVTLDYDKEQAELAYGREPMTKVALVPSEILAARSEQVARLKDAWPGSEAFFVACDSAYRARCGREGKPLGERVHIVDLIPELLVEYELRGMRKATSSFGRLELAFCLDRLAREGALEHGGRRLELGTATGGSTKDKKRVLFLTAGMGGGQYYLSVRVVPAGGAA